MSIFDEDPFEVKSRKQTKKVENSIPLFDNKPTDNKTSTNTPVPSDMEFSTPEMSDADRVEHIRRKALESVKEENGHVIEKQVPVMEFKSARKDTSPNVDQLTVEGLLRAEEIEAEIVRKAGRYIPNIDDVKPGVPYTTRKDERVTMLDNQTFAVPLINSLNINSDGVTIKGGGIFDPGEGAQRKVSFETNQSSNPNDPRSDNFITCNNSMCSYREGCLRYRLKNRRSQSFPFFPESCRKDGIYIGINDTDYQGYDPFDKLEKGASNVRSLPNP